MSEWQDEKQEQLSLAEAQALQSFGNRYYEFLLANKKLLDAMTDSELDCLNRAVEKANTSNCWYASYEAAQLLKRQIRKQREWRRQDAYVREA
jgi:hypothetical protein